jgi:IS30 family transposase
MIGSNHKKGIAKFVERKSEFAVLSYVTQKTSDLVSQTIIARSAYLTQRVRIVTYENGTEFADHAVLEEDLKLTCCFAASFASWQRNSDENFKGFLHQYIPKGILAFLCRGCT